MPCTIIGPSADAITTTDATETSAGAFGLPEDCVAEVEVAITARKDATNDVKVWKLIAACRRNGSGNVDIVDTVQGAISIRETLGAALWTANLEVDGSTLVCKVKGAASSTIVWGVSFYGQSATPA